MGFGVESGFEVGGILIFTEDEDDLALRVGTDSEADCAKCSSLELGLASHAT